MINDAYLIWKDCCDAIRSGKQEVLITYPMDSGVPGTHCVVATVHYLPYPVGVIYYRQAVKHTFEILDFYVNENLRGAGIGTSLLAGLEKICRSNKVKAIYTQEVTAKSKGIIAKAGYKKLADGYWLKLKNSK